MRDNEAMKVEHELRHPIVSGIFYPEEAGELRRLVRELVQQAESDENTQTSPADHDRQVAHTLRVLLVPHASYQHIGSHLAQAFASIPEPARISRAVLISSVHRDFEDAAVLPGFTAFDTPLGPVNVDTTTVRRLTEYGDPYKIDNVPHTEEHSQEVLLPMLHEYCPEASIVPLLLGSDAKGMLDAAAQQLLRTDFVEDPNTLWILSSNLSNFTDSFNSQKEAERFIEEIEHPSGQLIASRKIKACGRNGLYLLRQLFSGGIRFIK